MTHQGTSALETKRLILRQFVPEDASDMFENWANKEEVTRYLTWPTHKSVEITQALLQNWCSAYADPNYYNWVIEYGGSAVGNVSVVRLDERNEWAELGYCLGPAYWNKGIMTEAVKTVIDFLFREVGIHRIRISHATDNPASGIVAQKCGLTYEGTFREVFKASWGEFLDIAHHAIVRKEWESQI